MCTLAANDDDLTILRDARRQTVNAGYRLYDDRSLAKLAFIARAKQLGCSLDEITDLVVAWDGDRCEPVQESLRIVVEVKIAETQDQIVEMVAFTIQLRDAAAVLNRHAPDGPCDADCGCTERASSPSTVVALGERSDQAV